MWLSCEFYAAVMRLQDGAVASFHSVPQWVGYWSFPVLDPMENTVELSWPAENPSAVEWPAG